MALEDYAADPEARLHTFCHAVPGTWHAMGVMLSAAGSLRWLRDVAAADEPFADLVAGGGAVGARGRGAHVPALSLRRAHAPRRPRCPGRLRGPVGAPRPGRARPRCAGRGGVRTARTRSTCSWGWAQRPWSAGSRAEGRAATSGCASWPLCWSCRWSERPLTREPPSARHCSEAWRAEPGPGWRRPWPRRCGPRTWSSPFPSGSRPTARAASASGALDPALRPEGRS